MNPIPGPHTPSQSMHPRSGLCNLISDCTLHPGPHTPSLTVFPWSWTTHPISAHAFYPSCSLFPASSTTSQTIHRFLDYECSTRLQALIPDHTPHPGPCTPPWTMHPTLDHALSPQTERPILGHTPHPTVLPDSGPCITPGLPLHSCAPPLCIMPPFWTIHSIPDHTSYPGFCTPSPASQPHPALHTVT